VRLVFGGGCVVASYRGRYCAAMTWDALYAIERVMNNAALGVAARSKLAGNVPQQDTAPVTG
jgi:hypothetical protein